MAFPRKALVLTPPWQAEEMVLLPAADAASLCRDATHVPMAPRAARATVEHLKRRLLAGARDLFRYFAPASRSLASLTDDQLMALMVEMVQRGELVLVQGSRAKDSRGDRDTAKLRRIVRAIEGKTRGRLAVTGRRYRLVPDLDLGKLSDRDSYEVVAHAEAVATLRALAEQPGTPPEVVALLGQATGKLSADWRAPLQPDGLVLLRKVVVAQAAASPEAPITPSQMKALLDKRDWIEIEAVYEDDDPYTGPYRLVLPNHAVNESTFGKDGFYGNYDIDAGSCKLTLAWQGIGPSTPPPVVDQQVTFQARVCDQTNQPVSGVALVFQDGNKSQVVSTDGNGEAKYSTSGVDSVQVGFSDVGGLVDAITSLWAQCSGVGRADWVKPDATTTLVTIDEDRVWKVTPTGIDPATETLDAFTTVTATADQPITLSVQPLVCLLRLLGKHFDLNKCFLLPTALAGPREIVELQIRYHDAHILIVGHTDTSADNAYNLALSVERAKSMRAFLTNDVDSWLAWYDGGVADAKRWGTTEDNHMIGSLVAGSAYPATVLGYQQWHNAQPPLEARYEPLAEDGHIGPLTRRQLVLDYMHREGTTLPEGTPIEIHGCGELFPLDVTGEAIDTDAADGQHELQDRRVEVFFFPKELGVLPPVPGEQATKDEPEYPEWRDRSVDYTIASGPPILLPWKASWQKPDEPIKQGETRQMVLHAPDLLPGVDVTFEVEQVGFGVIGSVHAVSTIGGASAPWSDWFSPDRVAGSVTLGPDEKFPPVTFRFTASANGRSAQADPLAYGDTLELRVLYAAPTADPTAPPRQEYWVHSPWGRKQGWTVVRRGEDGWVFEEELPPGGISLVVGSERIVEV